MRLEEALLQLDSLYGDEAEKYACRIREATGSYVVYQIAAMRNQDPQWCQIVTRCKVDIMLLHIKLIKAEWYSLFVMREVDPASYDSDSWFVTILPELRDINNLFWERSEPEYDTVSST